MQCIDVCKCTFIAWKLLMMLKVIISSHVEKICVMSLFIVIPRICCNTKDEHWVLVVTFPENVTSVDTQLVTCSPSSGWSARESRWFTHDITVLFFLVSAGVRSKPSILLLTAGRTVNVKTENSGRRHLRKKRCQSPSCVNWQLADVTQATLDLWSTEVQKYTCSCLFCRSFRLPL